VQELYRKYPTLGNMNTMDSNTSHRIHFKRWRTAEPVCVVGVLHSEPVAINPSRTAELKLKDPFMLNTRYFIYRAVLM
jgi:hypothetical protein